VSRWFRVLIAVVALAPLSVQGTLHPEPGRAYVVETVEISEALGFNPTVCRMNREYIRFHNVGQTTVRVARPGVHAGDPPFDVQVIPPGGYSIEFAIPYGGNTKFINVDKPSQSMNAITPVFVTYWDPICTPDPNYQPPQPPCRSNPHCVRMLTLAVD
jgi:hypothetical protein